MKKLSTLYFFLFPLCLVLLLVRCHKDKADVVNQITILVKEKDTNLPISNANVRFCQSTNPASVNCQELGKTDDNGQLIFNINTSLVPGNAKFYVSKDGFKNDSILVSDPVQKMFTLNLKKIENLSNQIQITILVKEKKTNLPIPNASIFFCPYTYGGFGCQGLGVTDNNGKFTCNLDSALVTINAEFLVYKDGFYNGTIPVWDTIQTYSLNLAKISNLEFHLKYDSDSIPKKFLFYRRYLNPPAYNVPGGYNDEVFGFIYTSKVNGMFHTDTTIYLPIKYYTNSFHCTMCDPSYIFPSQSLVWSPNPEKVLTIPAPIGDTTLIFNAFW